MKIVVAPDKFKGSLTAAEAAAAIARGVRRVLPRAEILLAPIADGGEGTMLALVKATRGKVIRRRVVGPLGNTVTASFGIFGDNKTRRTAIIEMAEASGLKLVPPAKRNPLITTTYGTGQLIRAAVELGCKKIIVAIGGSATNDAGAGMAQALGWQLLDANGNQIPFGGGALKSLASIKSPIPPFSHSTIQIVVACDVKNPLYGKHGAAYIFAPQKGATPAMVRELDNGLRQFAKIVKRDLGKDVAHFAGAGAAGGLGAGLVAFLDAELRSGVELVLEAIGFDELLRGADLVITGEGKIDEQTAQGKAPWGVAIAAKKRGIPVIAFGGSIPACLSQKLRNHFDAVFPIASREVSKRVSMRYAKSLLEKSVATVIQGLRPAQQQS
jgi:glycerate kinase